MKLSQKVQKVTDMEIFQQFYVPIDFCINQTEIWEPLFSKENSLKHSNCQNHSQGLFFPHLPIVRFPPPPLICCLSLWMASLHNEWKYAGQFESVTTQYTEDKFINSKLERSSWKNTKAQGGITQNEQLAFLLVEWQSINFLSLWGFCTILGNFQI